MPSTSQALFDWAKEKFGSIDPSGPERFLTESGYELTRDWFWKSKPGLRSIDDIPDQEAKAIIFLIEEWDYGGVIMPS